MRPPQASTAPDVEKAIGQLSSFEFKTRSEAARTIRRASADVGVALLAQAARKHADEYVRYRALTLLAGFRGTATADVMRELRRDRNDRVRTVVLGWFEHEPDPGLLPEWIAALDTEGSEFVRPALTRAIAALLPDRRAAAALAPLVLRGDDFFRGAAIEAIGQYGGTFALKDLAAVAGLDGPLQDDAVTAIGRLGDETYVAHLAALQRAAPEALQPTIAAALCLLGRECVATEQYLAKTLTFAMNVEDRQPLLRSAVHGLAMLAQSGKGDMLKFLFDAGARSTSNASRSPVALGVGVTALRRPALLVESLETWRDLNGAVGVVRDAFDMLDEDLEEELFATAMRKFATDAPAGSRRRAVVEALMTALEF